MNTMYHVYQVYQVFQSFQVFQVSSILKGFQWVSMDFERFQCISSNFMKHLERKYI